MDVFAEHGVAGIVGLLFNALFGDDSIFGLDGVNTGTPTGGWVIHNWKQMYVNVRPFPAGLIASMSTWISIRKQHMISNML